MILLGVGSSIGNAIEIFKQAQSLLSDSGVFVVRASKNICTDPWGGVAKNRFTNAVWEVETALSPESLLAVLHLVESACGRVREQRWDDRTLDLDILVYGNKIYATDTLVLPHPQIAFRRFVLAPLAQLYGHDFVLVNVGTIGDLLDALQDETRQNPQNMNNETMNDIGVVGLGTMGANLARNAASRGYSVGVYNRTYAKTEALLAAHPDALLHGHQSLEPFVKSLKKPRRILIMVKAGKPVDMVADSLLPYLDPGDILIDGGNSLFADTNRRFETYKEKGIHFFGMGVSGGEIGALEGPSLMPGGEESVWEHLKPMLASMAADDFEGGKCVTYLGKGGAGHYVKMVHNGIEYAIMQMISEAYLMLRDGYKIATPEIANIFKGFNTGLLHGYLFEITIPVLEAMDGDHSLLDKILDTAGQKGTGRWTVVDGVTRGVDISTIAAAVDARVRSSFKSERVARSNGFNRVHTPTQPLEAFVSSLHGALIAAVLMAYVQGLELLRDASAEESWDLPMDEIVRIWQGGCIIRASVLKDLRNAFVASPGQSAFDMPFVRALFQKYENDLLLLTAAASNMHLATPAFSAAKNALIGTTTARGGANMIQGLRDYFGAHTYQRIDKEGSFHTEWDA